jgi:hypothetical protein
MWGGWWWRGTERSVNDFIRREGEGITATVWFGGGDGGVVWRGREGVKTQGSEEADGREGVIDMNRGGKRDIFSNADVRGGWRGRGGG